MWANLIEMGVQPSEIAQTTWRQYLVLLIHKYEQNEQAQGDDGLVEVNTLEDLKALRGAR